jgi:Spherulation-specific family 4
MRRAFRPVLASAALVALVLSSRPSTGVAQSLSSLRLAIPAYIFSDDLRGWEAIIDRASLTPIAVINPRNGPNVYAGTRCDGFTPPNDPGTGPNLAGLRFDDDFVSPHFPNDPVLVATSPNYLATLEQQFIRRSHALSASGIEVFGYVWSNTNGADAGCVRTPAIAADEIDLYRQVYGINNVFFDDASPSCPNDTRRLMSEVARSKGARVIMNPGTVAGTCLANEADVVVNFEGSSSAYFAANGALVANATVLRQANANVKIWHILYGVADVDVVGIVSQARNMSDFLYITDDTTQVHGCDRGTSNFDALYGTWPIVRQDIAACTGRSNGSAFTWSSIVDAITRAPVVPVARVPAPPAAGTQPTSGRGPAPAAPGVSGGRSRVPAPAAGWINASEGPR